MLERERERADRASRDGETEKVSKVKVHVRLCIKCFNNRRVLHRLSFVSS